MTLLSNPERPRSRGRRALGRALLLALLGVLPVATARGAATNAVVGPRYLVMMRQHERVLSIRRPESFRREAFEEVTRHFPPFAGPYRVKVGMGCIFPYFEYPLDQVEQCLRRFLAVAAETDTPVVVKLDGENWLHGRPDLWNWWDPARPGFNPANRANVEWTGWGPEYAIKISWRDWGRQLRVPPMINLMSPTYRAACHQAMARLVPIVRDWYAALPADKKDLFIGLNLGWESAVGNSSYYRPNGNDLLERPAQDDPRRPGFVWDDPLSRGMVQLGYAALTSAGIRTRGDITEEDLTEVARRHMADLCRFAREQGLPREKLFTHGVGNGKGEMLYDSAVNPWSCPGWSEYFHADDIRKDEGILRNVRRSDAPHWAAVEWLLLRELNRQAEWRAAFRHTLDAPGLKYLCLFNWELLLDKQGAATPAVQAAREAITGSDGGGGGTR